MFRALVIDDDKLIRWSLKEICSQEGHEVDAVASCDEAISQARGGHYGLIFADFDIDNSDSVEMLRTLNRLQPEAAVIILSALSRKQIEARISDLNVLKIVEKPFDSEEIREILRETLDLNR